ncbi:MAG: SDR family NAD(P)-dependent oxidoreductase, partial [Silvanigrellaceae bacterium]|nr:SDR family NAD(P)-dependent oxidoreductase [Silvanigrellaceae bacterium]
MHFFNFKLVEKPVIAHHNNIPEKIVIFCNDISLQEEITKAFSSIKTIIWVTTNTSVNFPQDKTIYLNKKIPFSYNPQYIELLESLHQNDYVLNAIRLSETDVEGELLTSLTSAYYFFQFFCKNPLTAPAYIHMHRNDVESGSLEGFFKSLKIEMPSFRFKSININQKKINHLSLVINEFHSFDEEEIVVTYENGKRFIEEIDPIVGEVYAEKRENIDESKTYLVTGGTGKLPLLVSRYIAKVTINPVILLGRRKLSLHENESLLRENILYFSCDVTQEQELQEVWSYIGKTVGAIHGVFHLAGIIEDALFINKDYESFCRVLAPKVKGLILLDSISKESPLDFFVVFSSLSGILGNLGQTDYAAANSFVDHFIRYRDDLVNTGNRVGKSISISWPLWESGGMIMPEKDKNEGLSNEEGIEAFEKILQMPYRNVAVFKGDFSKFQESLFKKIETRDDPGTISSEKLTLSRNILRKWLEQCFTKHTKLSSFDDSQTFQQYGIDSIVSLNITSDLEKQIRMYDASIRLNKTLLFEYQNLEDLTEYFATRQWSCLASLVEEFEKNNISSLISSISEFTSEVADRKPVIVSKDIVEEEKLIAVIGVALKVPGADNKEQFWQNLKQQKNCISLIPQDRWSWKAYYDATMDTPGKTYSRHGGFVSGIENFDPYFFNISPTDAVKIDPQERHLLQMSYHALEDTGYSTFPKDTGVFAAVMFGHYALFQTPELMLDSSYASVANRLSYFFNLTGPSIAFDTMCSGSLTALHFACNSLQSKECSLAIVAGANLMPHPHKYLLLAQGRFLSAIGKCQSFGMYADGYVPGEGIIVMVLKRYKEALEDGDQIYGVIRGSGVNSGGKTSGYTVPNPIAQSALIQKVLERSGVEANSISYIEA